MFPLNSSYGYLTSQFDSMNFVYQYLFEVETGCWEVIVSIQILIWLVFLNWILILKYSKNLIMVGLDFEN